MKIFRGKKVPENGCHQIMCSECLCGDVCEMGELNQDLTDYCRYGDLTKIQESWGLLPEDIKHQLREAHKQGGKIEVYDDGAKIWAGAHPGWICSHIYRLAPQKKDPLIGKEVEVKFDGVVYKAMVTEVK